MEASSDEGVEDAGDERALAEGLAPGFHAGCAEGVALGEEGGHLGLLLRHRLSAAHEAILYT
jgi:hypothetical protein